MSQNDEPLMPHLDLLKTMLLEEEGFREFPYRCTSGKLTIGIGRNLEDRGISRNEAMYLLTEDIEYIKSKLKEKLSFFADLNPIRQIVLMDMAFNLGINGLLAFKNTLNLISDGKYTQAAEHMLDSKWATQVGRRAIRLSNMMKDGVYHELE